MKRIVLYLSFLLITFSLSAQLVADAGGDKHFCTYPDSLNQLLIGGEPTASGGIEPYTYEWSIEPFALYEGSNITIITSHILDDTTSANPNVIDFTLRESFQFKLKVTDDIGQVAYDSCIVSFSAFAKTLIYYEYFVPFGDSVFLTKDVNIGQLFNEDSLLYEWTPSEILSESNLKTDFWAKPVTTTWCSVKITDKYGCEAQGDPYYHLVVQTLGIDENEMNGIPIFPNPFTDYLTIELEKQGQDYNFIIYQLDGKEVYNEIHSSGTNTVQLTDLPKGIYVLKILNDNEIIETRKIVKT